MQADMRVAALDARDPVLDARAELGGVLGRHHRRGGRRLGAVSSACHAGAGFGYVRFSWSTNNVSRHDLGVLAAAWVIAVSCSRRASAAIWLAGSHPLGDSPHRRSLFSRHRARPSCLGSERDCRRLVTGLGRLIRCKRRGSSGASAVEAAGPRRRRSPRLKSQVRRLRARAIRPVILPTSCFAPIIPIPAAIRPRRMPKSGASWPLIYCRGLCRRRTKPTSRRSSQRGPVSVRRMRRSA